MTLKKIESALISVYHKEGLEPIVQQLHQLGVRLISTGGTAAFIKGLGLPVDEVADLTDYPSIFGGRVKTLHPKVFGGILARRDHEGDQEEMDLFGVPAIDCVIVDLYPFSETVASGADHAAIIEKIDIGGIALIRAAAKNHKDVVIVPSVAQYGPFLQILQDQSGEFNLEQRQEFAATAFETSFSYDQSIAGYLRGSTEGVTSIQGERHELRYGENPHQKASFIGDIEKYVQKLGGKDFSYNNIVDVHNALEVMDEFRGGDPCFAILKHTNACGLAQGANLMEAWERALACDPVSAFGGILICNGVLGADVAEAVNKIFFEALIAEDFTEEALEILKKKKKRIILKQVKLNLGNARFQTAMGGVLTQERDKLTTDPKHFEAKTSRKASKAELQDAAFGEKVGKHLKSNAIAIVKDRQLIGSGIGQTSRVDALRQAIDKAGRMGFGLENAVVYSDAFFPFADCAQISHEAGIEVLVEPGGSIRDQETIDYCEQNGLCLLFTGHRHFKH